MASVNYLSIFDNIFLKNLDSISRYTPAFISAAVVFFFSVLVGEPLNGFDLETYFMKSYGFIP
jgi:hypothetical protein